MSGNWQGLPFDLKGAGLRKNFCPVSVLPVVAKLLKLVVHWQLYAYLHKQSVLNVAQLGFWPGTPHKMSLLQQLTTGGRPWMAAR